MPEHLSRGLPCLARAGGGRAWDAAPLAAVPRAACGGWAHAPPSPVVCGLERYRRGQRPPGGGAGRTQHMCVSQQAVPHGGRRSCQAGSWFRGCTAHVQTPQDSDLNPGLGTRGHRSAPSIPENTAIDERRSRGTFACVPRWHKTRAMSPPMCAMLIPRHATLACATWQRGFVSPQQGCLRRHAFPRGG
jgi:hypothetical protein